MKWKRDGDRLIESGQTGKAQKEYMFSGLPRTPDWRKRADEARSLADDMKDEISKQMMLQIADDYERLAKRAEQRANL